MSEQSANPKKRKSNGQRGTRHDPPTNAFPVGGPGGPGRPKSDPELVEAFRGRTMKALATLDKVMDDFAIDAQNEKGDPLIPATAAVKAAEVVLNRGWGAAPTTVKLDATLDATVKGEVAHDVKPLADPQRLARILQVARQAGVLVGSSGGQSSDEVEVETKDQPKEMEQHD